MSEELQHDLSDPDVFALLGKRRRRLALRILRESASPLRAMEIARYIGEREYESPATDAVNTVYVSLHHNHLPQLDEAGAVAYDRTEGTVRPGRNFDALVRVLEGVTARTNFSVGDRCPRCDTSVMIRISAAGCERPVCLQCERELRDGEPAP